MSSFLLLLVLVSGGAGLVYEVVWTRMLVHTLGSSAQAVASVLAAFLGGLAIGAAALGRRADRSARPLRFYAALETVIAVHALLFPLLLRAFQPVVLRLAAIGEPTHPLVALARFAGTFVLLLPATAAMGGTIPVLCRWAVRRDDTLGARVALLYAVNTLGAAAGCLLAGFVTIPRAGLSASLAIAAAGNVAVALAATVLDRRRGDVPTPAGAAGDDRRDGAAPAGRPPIDRRAAALLAAFAVSGLTALGYEVLWTRVLVFFVKSVTYGFSFMLATFLFGLVIGSAAARPLVDRRGWALPAFAFAELLAGAMAFASVRLLVTSSDTLRLLAPTPGGELGALYGPLAFLIVATILPAGVLFGATFPLAVRLYAGRADGASGRVGTATAANTGGAILGAFLTGFVLMPAIGVVASLKVLVAANVAAALLLAFGAAGTGRRARRLGGIVALSGAAVLAWALGAGDFFVEKLGELRPGRMTFVDEGEDVVVTVYEEPGPEGTIRTLYVNGSSYTGSRFFARRYMKTMGHLPLLLCEERRRALVICLGTGMTLSALARHESLEEVACAELSPGVRRALPLFGEVNDHVADNPRVDIHIQDGRHWVLTNPARWDVITLEPPPPLNAGVGDLYSREFYELCRDHLAPGGVLCQWFPMHSQTVDEFRMALATFADVFPDASLWLPVGRNAVGIGIREGGTPWTFDRMAERFREPPVADGLRAIGFASPEALLATFLLDAESIARFVDGVPLVTDDRPRLEFHDLAKAGQRFPAGELLGRMMPLRIDAAERLARRGRADGIDLDAYRRSATGLEHFYRGAFLFEAHRPADAGAEWQEALRTDPGNAYYRSILGGAPGDADERP